MKRVIAALLCICMIGTTEGFYVQASSIGTNPEQETVEEEKTTSQEETPEEVQEKETSEEEQQETDDSKSVLQKDLQSDDSKIEQSKPEEQQDINSGEAETQETDAQEDTPVLNYAVINSSYLETPGTQSVVVSAGSEGAILDTATLQYINQTTGEVYETNVQQIYENAMLFSMDFPDEQSTGIYQLTSVTYTIEGKEYTSLFADAKMQMQFGVNVEVATTPDNIVIDETEEGVSMDVVTIDENGNTTSQNDIEQAIENSSNETVLDTANIQNQGISAFSVAPMGASSNIVVVLDPGHDNVHTGGQGTGLDNEQVLNLKIAQYCKAELQSYNGVTVYMTRDGEACPYSGTTTAVCNRSRADYAKSVGANIFVSFHNNIGGGNGAEVYYPNQNYNAAVGTQGQALAQQVLAQLVALGLGNRGIKLNDDDGYTYPDGSAADDLTVINRSKRNGIPAILIEHAFMDSSDASNYLNSDAKLQKLGVADATGIANYFGLSKQPSKPAKATITKVQSTSNTKLKVTWNSISGATGYKLQRKDSADGSYKTIKTISSATEISYEDTGLTTGHTYYYRVRGFNDAGNGSYSSIKSGKTVAKTKITTTKASGSGKIYLAWKKVSGASGYTVYRSTSANGTYQKVTTLSSASKISYTDTGLSNNKNYYYKVTTNNKNDGVSGSSGKSAYVIGKTVAKTSITAIKSIGNKALTVSWKKVSGASGYKILRSTSANGTYQTVATIKSGSTTSYTDKSVKTGKNYYYKIKCYNQVNGVTGAGSYCTPTYGKTVKSTSINYIKSTSSSKLYLNWKKASGANGYYIYRSTSKDGTYKKVATVSGASTTTYTDSGLSKGKTYYYKIKTRNKVNGTTGYSSYSGALNGTTAKTTSINYVKSTANKKLVINWNAVSGANGYYIYRSTSEKGTYSKIATVSGKNSTSYTDSSVSTAKKYYYKIKVRNKVNGTTGYGSYSKIVYGKTMANTSINYVQSTSDTKLKINWDAVSGANGYYIYRSTSEKGTYSKIATVSGKNSTSYTDSSVSTAKKYYYKIKVRNKVNGTTGYSSYSKPFYGKTVAKTTITDLSFSDNGVTVKWNKISGASGYYISRKVQGGSYAKIAEVTSGSTTSYVDSKITAGNTYYYKIESRNKVNDKKGYSGYCSAKSIATGTAIMGASQATVTQMVSYYNGLGVTYPSSIYASKGAADINTFCTIVMQEATVEGVRADVLFAQICLETGSLQFGGDVQSSQCNFGGIGATGNGVAGNTYADVRTGIRAQVQHLKAYASTEALKQTCVDDRFKYVTRGCAPIVEWLSQQTNPKGYGWAADSAYGTKLLAIMSRIKLS